jgi:hypothetical protein
MLAESGITIERAYLGRALNRKSAEDTRIFLKGAGARTVNSGKHKTPHALERAGS